MRKQVVCVVEDFDGRRHTQLSRQPFVCPEGGHVVLYQKGLEPVQHLPPRNNGILSNYFVEFEGHKVRVPWKHLVWRGDDSTRPEGRDPTILPSCEDLVVVGMVDETCQAIFGWFVVDAARDAGWRLVEIDREVVRKVVSAASLPAVRCECGRCKHPLKSMMTAKVPSVSLTEIAARSFSSFRQAIKREMKSPYVAKKKRPLRNVSHGECIVCYEECAADPCCPSKQCNTVVCSACKQRLRGLCPLCDRSKTSSFYECQSCGRVVNLDDFGAPCLECTTMLCVHCYKNYARCTQCSSKAANRSMPRLSASVTGA